MQLYLKNKQVDTRRKFKLDQLKLDYENKIIRNRLINATINGAIQHERSLGDATNIRKTRASAKSLAK